MRKLIYKIEFANKSGTFDFPNNTPIPLIGHRIEFEGKQGVVYDVAHYVDKRETLILIRCK